MTAAAQSAGDARARKRSKRTFASVLLAIGLSLLALGLAGFGYLRVHSPTALLSGGSRPIAAATMFVPRRSLFTFSLLTRPERLISLQQAVVSPDYRPRAEREVAQLQHSLKELSGLDYWKDVLPWAGEEITFAYTSADIDRDEANGLQPGYLLAVEIAPGQRLRAQEFLQLFWQQQSLAGYPPQSQQVSGVPILSSSAAAKSTSKLMTATALIGGEFVLFSNSAEVIRSSVHSAQTADNLAQDQRYRTVAEQLSEPRIALAYFNIRLLAQKESASISPPSDSFVAVSIELTQAGLTADVKRAGGSSNSLTDASVGLTDASTGLSVLDNIPDNSQLVISGDHIDRLQSILLDVGLSPNLLPDFLTMGSSQAQMLWQSSDSGYALAQLGSSRGRASDWLLAVARTDESVEALDEAAKAAGYSVVPVQIADRSATAWTRFKASSQRRSGSALETELLGLHLQQASTEFFANSLDALEVAVGAAEHPIARSARFQDALAHLDPNNHSYLYADGPAATRLAEGVFSVPGALWRVALPLTDHISAIAATPRDDKVRVFVQLHE